MAQGVARMGRQSRTWTVTSGRLLFTSVIALSLNGCGAYLHDTRLATSTSELKATYEKLEAPAMIAELQQREESFATAETRALLEQGVVSRNEILANVIRTPPLREQRPGELRTGTDLLRGDVSRKLERLFGPGSFDARTKQMLFNAPEQIREGLTNREETATRLAAEAADFVRARDAYNRALAAGARRDERKSDCPTVLINPPAERPGTTLERSYFSLFGTCGDLAEIDADLAAVNGALMTRAGTNSQLAAAYKELTRLRDSRKAGQEEAKRLKELLQSIEKKSETETSVRALNDEIKSFQSNWPRLSRSPGRPAWKACRPSSKIFLPLN